MLLERVLSLFGQGLLINHRSCAAGPKNTGYQAKTLCPARINQSQAFISPRIQITIYSINVRRKSEKLKCSMYAFLFFFSFSDGFDLFYRKFSLALWDYSFKFIFIP